MSPIVVNILDLIDLGGDNVIEPKLATFTSPQNPEIEDFIRNKAIQFAIGKLSITYLVSDEYTGNILGYFTLTHKSIFHFQKETCPIFPYGCFNGKLYDILLFTCTIWKKLLFKRNATY
ncbi:hypothetical protein BXO88_16095 [Oribacterium sp. C9]|uniref:hypothetical protein n=1 Tax=Oribacterium sp. C9 TaxID=1943579 RepID=UPI00098F81B4|nr:hypothetical protein [Oribacterium sp. C9]OON84672.1 hypothetical protein BXO88_16095 [Oribacterium sp. C9]